MKELSIEEKAKAYDEAIETARKINNGEGVAAPSNWSVCEVVFPELKESDDERIRKGIIKSIMDLNNDWLELHGVTKETALTWLEKQDEHANFRNKIQIGDKVTRNRDGVLVNLSQLNRVAKKDEKQGKQKPNYNNKELKDVVIAELNKYNSNGLNAPWATDSTGLQYPLYFANLGAKWQEEQKPAWSEEDESLRRRCIGAIDMANLSDYTKDNLLNWLKSLKDRLQLQPKSAWSEEDATHYNRILKELNLQKEMPINASVIEEVKSDIIWFKSLKDRIQLKPKWKPSDEQMDALYTYIYNPQYFSSPDPRMELVESVYKDLKKLREE